MNSKNVRVNFINIIILGIKFIPNIQSQNLGKDFLFGFN